MTSSSPYLFLQKIVKPFVALGNILYRQPFQEKCQRPLPSSLRHHTSITTTPFEVNEGLNFTQPL